MIQPLDLTLTPREDNLIGSPDRDLCICKADGTRAEDGQATGKEAGCVPAVAADSTLSHMHIRQSEERSCMPNLCKDVGT